MRFTEWKGEVPKKRSNKMYKLEAGLKEFMAMNVKVAKVTWTDIEYKSSRSCYESLHKAAKKFGFPIDVTTRKGEIFLIRRDI